MPSGERIATARLESISVILYSKSSPDELTAALRLPRRAPDAHYGTTLLAKTGAALKQTAGCAGTAKQKS